MEKLNFEKFSKKSISNDSLKRVVGGDSGTRMLKTNIPLKTTTGPCCVDSTVIQVADPVY